MINSIPPEKRLDYLDQQLNQKRQIKIKTCADIYNYWRSYKRLYKKAPKDGVEFQVDYIDTGFALCEETRDKAPIALALHGAPGSYHDFALLIHHLSQQNVRVIAPNFPEYTATVKTKVLFRHSADEKAAYLRDFLKAINVNKIDLLVSHSSAIFPTLLILLNANNESMQRQQNLNEVIDQDTTKVITTKLSIKEDVNLLTNNGNDDKVGVEEVLIKVDNDRQQPNFIGHQQEVRSDYLNEVDPNNKINYDDNKSQIENTTGISTCERRHKLNKKPSRKSKSQDVIVKFDQPIEIKAVALFNPAGHRLPKSMKPTWFKCGSVHVYQHKIGRSLFRKLGPAFLTVVGVPVRVDNMDNVMLSATVMRNSKCQRVIHQLEVLSQMQIPSLLVFSENDKLIEKEIFYEMAQFMRLDTKNFDVFSDDGDLELSQSSMEDWIRVMVFKAGGHYAYSNYAKTVNNAVSELLKRVVNQNAK